MTSGGTIMYDIIMGREDHHTVLAYYVTVDLHGYIQQKYPLRDHSERINAAILDQNLRIFVITVKCRIKRCKYNRILLRGP